MVELCFISYISEYLLIFSCLTSTLSQCCQAPHTRLKKIFANPDKRQVVSHARVRSHGDVGTWGEGDDLPHSLALRRHVRRGRPLHLAALTFDSMQHLLCNQINADLVEI